MSNAAKASDIIGGIWIAAVTVAIVSGFCFLYGFDQDNDLLVVAGWVTSALGSVLLSIGSVAVGVRLGVQAAKS